MVNKMVSSNSEWLPGLDYTDDQLFIALGQVKLGEIFTLCIFDTEVLVLYIH